MFAAVCHHGKYRNLLCLNKRHKKWILTFYVRERVGNSRNQQQQLAAIRTKEEEAFLLHVVPML